MKKDLIEKIDISLEKNSDYREMTILTLQSAKEVLQIYMSLESDYLASQKILDNEIASFKDRTQEVKDKIDEFYNSSTVTLEQVKQAEELCESIKEQVLNYSKHIDEIQDKIDSDKKEMESIKNNVEELEKQTEENTKQANNALSEIEKNKIETLEQLKEAFTTNLSNLEEKITEYDKNLQEFKQEIEDSKTEFQTLATTTKTEINTLGAQTLETLKDSKNEIDDFIETSKTSLQTQLDTSLEQLDNEASNLKTEFSTQADDFKNEITSYIDTSKEQIEQSLKPLSNLSSLNLSHYKFTDEGALFISNDGVEKKFLLQGDIQIPENTDKTPQSEGFLFGEDTSGNLSNIIPKDILDKQQYSFLSPYLWRYQTHSKTFDFNFTFPQIFINARNFIDGYDNENNSTIENKYVVIHSLQMGDTNKGIDLLCSVPDEVYGGGIKLRSLKDSISNTLSITESGTQILSYGNTPDNSEELTQLVINNFQSFLQARGIDSSYNNISSEISISPQNVSITSQSFTFNGREVLFK